MKRIAGAAILLVNSLVLAVAGVEVGGRAPLGAVVLLLVAVLGCIGAAVWLATGPRGGAVPEVTDALISGGSARWSGTPNDGAPDIELRGTFGGSPIHVDPPLLRPAPSLMARIQAQRRDGDTELVGSRAEPVPTLLARVRQQRTT